MYRAMTHMYNAPLPGESVSKSAEDNHHGSAHFRWFAFFCVFDVEGMSHRAAEVVSGQGEETMVRLSITILGEISLCFEGEDLLDRCSPDANKLFKKLLSDYHDQPVAFQTLQP